MRQRSLAASTRSRNVMFLCKVESQYLVGAFSPFDRAPCFRTQSEGEILDRGRMGRVAAARLRRPAWPRARLPHQDLRLNACHIALAKLRNARTQLGIVAVAGVQQSHIAGKADLARPANLLQRDLRLGLERDLLRR